MAGIVIIKVLKTIFKLLAFLTSLIILPILNALIILVAPPKEKLVLAVIIRLANEPITMIKSNKFQESLKYYL